MTRSQNYPLHIALFIATVLTTLYAGAFWGGHPAVIGPDLREVMISLASGIPYSFSLLLFLSVHEFGHYFATVRHDIRATLPFYIPLPPLPMFFSLGTMGAVIRIKEKMTGTNALFDIGVSGPLCGFMACTGLLVYGFLNLPPADFIFTIHPEYINPGAADAAARTETLHLGKNLLWIMLERIIEPENLPPMTEMYHYPFLFAGWLGTVVTALNLLPVGQLDGGHIVYAMFGRNGLRVIAKIFLISITLLGLPSFVELLLLIFSPGLAGLVPDILIRYSWSGWLLWAFILQRLIGTGHPPAGYEHSLDPLRRSLGWVAIALFFLCFTPVPFGVR